MRNPNRRSPLNNNIEYRNTNFYYYYHYNYNNYNIIIITTGLSLHMGLGRYNSDSPLKVKMGLEKPTWVWIQDHWNGLVDKIWWKCWQIDLQMGQNEVVAFLEGDGVGWNENRSQSSY